MLYHAHYLMILCGLFVCPAWRHTVWHFHRTSAAKEAGRSGRTRHGRRRWRRLCAAGTSDRLHLLGRGRSLRRKARPDRRGSKRYRHGLAPARHASGFGAAWSAAIDDRLHAGASRYLSAGSRSCRSCRGAGANAATAGPYLGRSDGSGPCPGAGYGGRHAADAGLECHVRHCHDPHHGKPQASAAGNLPDPVRLVGVVRPFWAGRPWALPNGKADFTSSHSR